MCSGDKRDLVSGIAFSRWARAFSPTAGPSESHSRKIVSRESKADKRS